MNTLKQSHHLPWLTERVAEALQIGKADFFTIPLQ
jgi:hypothetical protein